MTHDARLKDAKRRAIQAVGVTAVGQAFLEILDEEGLEIVAKDHLRLLMRIVADYRVYNGRHATDEVSS